MTRRSLSPEEAASGLGHPGVAELVALIHRVNPTDRELAPATQAQRYILKARLQSRLVRDWADHLVFRLDEADETLVSIQHRGHARDAAHVPLAALDPDARSRVRRALDLPPEVDPPLAHDGGPQLPTDPLSVGRRALEEWDYETARDRFEAAFASGSEPAAHALLDLLVDHLALDADALALDLPERLLSARVSRLVALAAARAGDLRRAGALLRRLDSPAEAEVRLVLADRALAERAAGDIRGHLTALRALDPANGALTRIEDGLRAIEAADRAPLEASLAQAVDRDDPPAIRAAATALLVVAPSHGGARSALARLDERDREGEITKALASAEANGATGRWDAAVDDLQRAASLGAEVRERLDTARGRLAKIRAEHATTVALLALGSGDLDAYLALPADHRAAVRDRASDPRLDRLERLVAERVRDPVAALTSLERAEAELGRGHPDAALAALQPGAIHELTTARPVVAAIREALHLQARRRAGELLEQIVGLVECGDDAAASAIADTLRTGHLAGPARETADGLVRDLRARVADAGLVAAFDHEVVAGRPFVAREIAGRALAARPEDRSWRGRRDALETRISRLFPSRVVSPWSADLHDVHAPRLQLSADACLEADGRHAWLAEARATFVFLRRIEVATSQVVSCTVVRTVEPITRPRVGVFGARVCLAGVGGRILVLRMAEGGRCEQIVGYAAVQCAVVPAPEYVDPGRDAEVRPLIRDFSRGDDQPQFFVWDLPATKQLFAFTGLLSAHPVRIPAVGPRTLEHTRSGEVRLFDRETRGTERVGYALRVDAAVVGPRPDTIVCAGAFPPGDARDPAIAILDPASTHPKIRIGLPKLEGISPLATSRIHRRTYLLGHLAAGDHELMAFDANLERRWALRHPSLVHLLTDADDNHAAIVFLTERGPVLQTLGADRPEVPPDAVSADSGAPMVDSAGTWLSLAPLPPELHQRVLGVREAIARADRATTPAARFEALDEQQVWQLSEHQSLARLADAALDWEDGPWAQRVHAVAAWVDAWMRRDQVGEGLTLDEVPDGWGPERLEAVKDRGWSWLEARSDEDLGLLRAGPGQPLWPSAGSDRGPDRA